MHAVRLATARGLQGPHAPRPSASMQSHRCLPGEPLGALLPIRGSTGSAPPHPSPLSTRSSGLCSWASRLDSSRRLYSHSTLSSHLSSMTAPGILGFSARQVRYFPSSSIVGTNLRMLRVTPSASVCCQQRAWKKLASGRGCTREKESDPALWETRVRRRISHAVQMPNRQGS